MSLRNEHAEIVSAAEAHGWTITQNHKGEFRADRVCDGTTEWLYAEFAAGEVTYASWGPDLNSDQTYYPASTELPLSWALLRLSRKVAP